MRFFDEDYTEGRTLIMTAGSDQLYANGIVQVPTEDWSRDWYQPTRFYVMGTGDHDTYFGAIVEPFALNVDGDYALDVKTGLPVPVWANVYANGISNPSTAGNTTWDALNNAGPATMLKNAVGDIDEAHIGSFLHRYKGSAIGIDEVTFHGPGWMNVKGLKSTNMSEVWVDFGSWNGKNNGTKSDRMTHDEIRFNGELGWDMFDERANVYTKDGIKYADVFQFRVHADSIKKAVDPDGAGDHYGQEFMVRVMESSQNYGIDVDPLTIKGWTGDSWRDDFQRAMDTHADKIATNDYWSDMDQIFFPFG
jgi:hypothetical protein